MSENNFEGLLVALSENVKRLRTEKGIAQEALALKAGVDRTMLSKIERKVTNPSLMALAKLSTALDIEVADLLRKSKK